MRYSDQFGCWQLDDLPGCSQVCVSHSAFVLPSHRDKGFGDQYHKQRLQQIKDLKYDSAIATVDEENHRQIKILTNNGWSRVHVFESSKTKHKVGLWVKDVRDS